MESITLPLIGGLLIGLSSGLLLWCLGQVAGISGIYSSMLNKPRKEQFWKISFILGLLAGGIIMNILYRNVFFNYSIEVTPLRVIVAGILVGLGTRLGNGCTSGHGVCGISRMSKRSIIATVTFILTGILTVAVERILS